MDELTGGDERYAEWWYGQNCIRFLNEVAYRKEKAHAQQAAR